MTTTTYPDIDSGHKTCPMCAEDILAAARKCKHCGEYLAADIREELDLPPLLSPDERHKRAHDPERVLYEAHPSMFRNSPVGFILCLLLCFALIGFILILAWWLDCKGTQLTITNKKTILRKGILSKYTNEVFHSDVRNVQISQSFLQRMLNAGTVGISSAGQSGLEINVTGLPDPTKARDLINQFRKQG